MRRQRTLALLVCLLAALMAYAQDDDLTVRLRQLPASIGENRIITVQPGESWVDIGIREHVGYEHLRRANPGGFASGSILIPDRHQVEGLISDGVIINLPELMDFRWANGQVAARYPIAIGRITRRTPTGELKSVNRIKNPSWRRPNGSIMPHGPRNPLGDRWIGLSRSGYGMHGTSDAGSIGRLVSSGCIRHFPQHIRELFEDAWVGMPVIITYETLTVGQENGIVYLSIFPDVYRLKTNTLDRAQKRLASFGVEQAITQQELGQRLNQADGVARPILGSDTPVTLNGVPLRSPIGPSIRDGQSYLPLRHIVEQLGASVRWDNAGKTATITRGEEQVTFTANGTDAFIALETVFVSIRTTVERLGGTVNYDPQQGIALSISPAG